MAACLVSKAVAREAGLPVSSESRLIAGWDQEVEAKNKT